MDENTTLTVRKVTREKLGRLGGFNDSMDAIITRLLENQKSSN